MTEGGEEEREPPEDESNRAIENVVMLGFFVVLVAAGIWCSAPWPMYERRRTAPARDAAIAQRSTCLRDSKKQKTGEHICEQQSSR